MTELRSEPTRRPGGQELLTLQYLRALAALSVVYYHVVVQLSHSHSSNAAASPLGACGVDLFFTISGFIMFYISSLRLPTPARFFQARLLRIAPIYWLVTIAMFVAPLVSKTIGWSSTLDPRQLGTSILFVGGMHWSNSIGDYPVYRAGWTLNYEMLFYALFAVGLVWKSVPRCALFVSAVLLTLVGLGFLLNPSDGPARFYTAPIMTEFAFGMVIAALYVAGRRMWWPFALLSIVAGLAALVFWAGISDPRSGPIVRGIPSGFIVAGSVSLERTANTFRIQLIKTLGDASYSIYLTHLFTLPLFGILWGRLFHQANPTTAVAFIIAGLVVAAAGGVAFYFAVERPLHLWSRRLIGRPSLRASSSGGQISV